MKKFATMAISVALIGAMVAGGSLAYLSDTDSDVNVMTLGNVKIVQNEEQRVEPAKNGALTESDIEAFVQDKPLLPYVDVNLNHAMGDDYEEVTFPDGKTYKLFIGDNAIDKFISVTNTGKSEAYVRTIVALEAPTDKIDLSFNSTDWKMDKTASSYSIEKDGVKYDLFVCYYKETLKPGETTPYNLMQISLDWTATNEETLAYGDTYEVLALSQAVQTAGFDDVKDAEGNVIKSAAQVALEAGFGEITEDNIDKVAEWFDAAPVKTSGLANRPPKYAPAAYNAFMEEARGSDGSYVLSDDMTTDNIIHFGPGTNVALNLNGKTITAEKTDQFALGAQQGSKLHLTGDGTVEMGKGLMANKGDAEIIIDGGTYNATKTTTLNSMAFNSLAQNNAKIVINEGTFTTNVDNAALFFATSNAVIEVNGGFFENTVDKTPDLFSMGTNSGNTNRIIFKGGTFVNWNPLDDRMCYTGAWPESYEQFSGPWMLVWDGYKVVSETQDNGDVWYSVVPE